MQYLTILEAFELVPLARVAMGRRQRLACVDAFRTRYEHTLEDTHASRYLACGAGLITVTSVALPFRGLVCWKPAACRSRIFPRTDAMVVPLTATVIVSVGDLSIALSSVSVGLSGTVSM